MTTEVEIHPIQGEVLRVLTFKQVARFSQLNSFKVTSDHFNFHVKRLLELALVEKTSQGLYSLSIKGKEFANRMDTDTAKLEKQAKLSVVVVGVREVHGRIQYLVQQRLKQPYYGFYGFVSGKMRWGETVQAAASRELQEEAGVSGYLELVMVEHKMDYDQNKQLLDDKFFYVFKAINLKGRLLAEFEGGQNMWLTKEKIERLPKLFDDVLEILAGIENSRLTFVENKFTVKGY
jgi:ADP-ribose pyrophosphatase YjhB (NUDIX family)